MLYDEITFMINFGCEELFMKNKPLYLILLISILTFISVTYIFTAKHGYMYDQAIIDWIDRISSATLVKTMDLVSMLGSSEMILFVTFGIARSVEHTSEIQSR